MISREDFYEFIEKAKGYCGRGIFFKTHPISVSDDITDLLKIDADYLYTVVKEIDEYKVPILTDSEKEYLKAVIKPFKDRVNYIVKIDGGSGSKEEYLMITVNSIVDYVTMETISLPYFIKGSKYVNMEWDRKYTLKELGLED